MSRSLVALGLGSTVLLAGCVSLPSEGPIEVTQASGRGVESDAMNINPRGPQPGQSAPEIVQGWLDAMQATPIRTTVAREFLSDEARDRWSPTETITYAAASPPSPGPTVGVKLTGAASLDDRGAWQGPLTQTESNLSIAMVQEDGEFRISQPPNALIVPETWFEQRFQQVSLYFFDPTAQVLVPDPVFVPRGEQLASALVDGLLAGPGPDLVDYTVNAMPTGMRSAVSVPVSDAGLADVQLTGAPASGGPAPQNGDLVVAQLAWTLRQDSSVESLRVSIDGEPVEAADGETEFSIEVGERFAPYVSDASTLVYGLADGVMVAGSAQNLDPVSGPFGQVDLGLRTISPDLRADRAAGVTSDGSDLLVGPVRAGGPPMERILEGASDLLDPAWDFSGRLWVVDRGVDGAKVRYLQGGRLRTLDVPGISGSDVKLMLVSRDASRLVAVVRRPKDDMILVSRLLSNGQGQILEARPAVPVSEQDGRGLRIRDIAWRSPTSIVVLHTVSDQLFQVRSVTVDGAPTGLDSLSLTLDGVFSSLAGTPKPDESVYAVTRGALIDLSGAAAGTTEIDPDVTSLGYVG